MLDARKSKVKVVVFVLLNYVKFYCQEGKLRVDLIAQLFICVSVSDLD